MSRYAQRPIKSDRSRQGETSYLHPSFAVVAVSHTQSAPQALFGSELMHSNCVRVTVNLGELCRGELRDRIAPLIDGQNNTIIEWDMSANQWAEFITSSQGKTTPITLRRAPVANASIETKPDIEPLQSKAANLQQDFQADVARAVKAIQQAVGDFKEAFDSGAGKKDLRERIQKIEFQVANLPSNLKYAVGLAGEVIEAFTTTAKADLEAYTEDRLVRMGYHPSDKAALPQSPLTTDDD